MTYFQELQHHRMVNQAGFKKEIDKSLQRGERIDVLFFDELHGVDKGITIILNQKLKAITMQAELQISRLKASNELLQQEVATLQVSTQKGKGLQQMSIEEIILALPEVEPDATTAFFLFQ